MSLQVMPAAPAWEERCGRETSSRYAARVTEACRRKDESENTRRPGGAEYGIGRVRGL